jgi:cysteine-rich repeat protein
MKMRLLLGLGILAGLSACKKADSVVLVNVSINADVSSVYSLRASMSTAQAHDSKIYPDKPSATAMPSSASFAIVLPRSRTGRLDLAVDGVGTADKIVAHGTAQTDIIVGGMATVSIIVAAEASLCGNGVVDPGETCDDGNQFSFDGCDFHCQIEGPGADAGVPDAAMAGTEKIDASVPDGASPDITMVEASVPDSANPDTLKMDAGVVADSFPVVIDDARAAKSDTAVVSPPDTANDVGAAKSDVATASLLDTANDVIGAKSDVVVAGLLDAVPGYTSNGILVYLGRNPCGDAPGTTVAHSGWYPLTGGCYTTNSATATRGVCGVEPQSAMEIAFAESHGINTAVCGTTYAPGTLLIWDSTDPRFHYLDDPSGGNVCLPNAVPYVVPCS